jgi:hypothetical protein
MVIEQHGGQARPAERHRTQLDAIVNGALAPPTEGRLLRVSCSGEEKP